MDGKGKWAASFATCAVLIALMLAAYVGAYFWLSTPITPGFGITNRVDRFYDYGWLREMFRPASWVESRFRGTRVEAHSRDYNPFE